MRAKTTGGQRLEQIARIAVMNADIGELLLLDERQQLCDTIDEGFGTDEIDVADEARPDAPDARRRRSRSRARFRASPQARRREIDPQARQQLLHQLQMMTAQGMALAPPVELMAPFRRPHFTAALSALTRSVFSQEKPPSASAARPKWP